jgi:7-cyano-7-deazaguanine synthase
MKNTTLLLSGGPDSVTLGYYLKDQKIDVNAITFLHKPRGSNIDEVYSAEYFAKKLKISHKIVDVSFLVDLYGYNKNYKFSLGGAKDCIPNNLQQTPLSVHLMLMMASMYSISNNIFSLSWAIHQDDFIKIAENEFEKIKYFVTELISDEIGQPFEILTPFQKLHKQDIVKISNEFNIELDKTISCFDSIQNKPCGVCIKCIERENAFVNGEKYLIDLWQNK